MTDEPVAEAGPVTADRKNPPLVFVAMPSTADPVVDMQLGVGIAERMIEGHRGVPVLPQLDRHAWNLISWHPDEFWYDRAKALLEHCGELWRIEGNSYEADAMVNHAKTLGVQIVMCDGYGRPWAVKAAELDMIAEMGRQLLAEHPEAVDMHEHVAGAERAAAEARAKAQVPTRRAE